MIHSSLDHIPTTEFASKMQKPPTYILFPSATPLPVINAIFDLLDGMFKTSNEMCPNYSSSSIKTASPSVFNASIRLSRILL